MYRPNDECCMLYVSVCVILLRFDNGADALANDMRGLRVKIKSVNDCYRLDDL